VDVERIVATDAEFHTELRALVADGTITQTQAPRRATYASQFRLPEGEAVEELRRTVGERMANEATSATHARPWRCRASTRWCAATSHGDQVDKPWPT
jgi:hypothetical protein